MKIRFYIDMNSIHNKVYAATLTAVYRMTFENKNIRYKKIPNNEAINILENSHLVRISRIKANYFVYLLSQLFKESQSNCRIWGR